MFRRFLAAGLAGLLALLVVTPASADAGPELVMGTGDAGGQLAVIRAQYRLVPNPGPNQIATGPDGNLWVTGSDSSEILRITLSGHIRRFHLRSGANPVGITSGPDGRLWFAECESNAIGAISLRGAVTEYPIPTAAACPAFITTGPDGKLWFTETLSGSVASITTTGSVSEYHLPTSNALPYAIAAGPDGNLWFTEPSANQIGRITTGGTVTEFAIPTPDALVTGIVSGPGPYLSFTEASTAKLGRISTSGQITERALGPGLAPGLLTVGPDGNSLWITETKANSILYLNGAGELWQLGSRLKGGRLSGVAPGPDGNVWYTDRKLGLFGYVSLNLPSAPGQYRSVVPFRLADTRDGTGGVAASPIGGGGTLTVPVAGRGGVPSTGVLAVVVNVTVTNPSTGGYLTVYPTGSNRPTASNLNFGAGQTVPNLVQVALGEGGAISFYNSGGSTDVIADVAGYMTDGGGTDGLYVPVTPTRVLDTRSGVGVPAARVEGGGVVALPLAGSGGLPASGVGAVILNVTVTNPSAGGYLTVWPDGQPRPVASNVNFQAGQTVANRVVVKVGAGGKVDFYKGAGSADVIADVVGWYTDAGSSVPGSRYVALAPKRILDTRFGNGGYGSPIENGGSIRVLIAGAGYVPGMRSATPPKAVVANLTVTNSTESGYLTAYPFGSSRPTVSDLNFEAGQTVPNLVVVQLGPDGSISLFNLAGRVDVLLDVVGYYF